MDALLGPVTGFSKIRDASDLLHKLYFKSLYHNVEKIAGCQKIEIHKRTSHTFYFLSNAMPNSSSILFILFPALCLRGRVFIIQNWYCSIRKWNGEWKGVSSLQKGEFLQGLSWSKFSQQAGRIQKMVLLVYGQKLKTHGNSQWHLFCLIWNSKQVSSQSLSIDIPTKMCWQAF